MGAIATTWLVLVVVLAFFDSCPKRSGIIGSRAVCRNEIGARNRSPWSKRNNESKCDYARESSRPTNTGEDHEGKILLGHLLFVALDDECQAWGSNQELARDRTTLQKGARGAPRQTGCHRDTGISRDPPPGSGERIGSRQSGSYCVYGEGLRAGFPGISGGPEAPTFALERPGHSWA